METNHTTGARRLGSLATVAHGRVFKNRLVHAAVAFALVASVALPVVCHAGGTLSAPWVSEQPKDGAFPLVANGRCAVLVVPKAEAKVVGVAARDLAADIERVTGVKAAAQQELAGAKGPAVIIGILGQAGPIDDLVTRGQLDVGRLRGAWESFVIATVSDPWPGVPKALVIVGSDRRGTAFGVYELSQAMGVSPWYWWADVAPEHHASLYVAAGTRRAGPPSVKFRGIFLNDEDWGLQPWAAKTFEPEHGGIGPKTYTKLFELMLRLKANTVWPAMHECTKPFNDSPENREIADDYAIVMGSSHAEPMLRDNVGEWKEAHDRYNYVTNRDGVRGYWEQRVKENGGFENIYTLGMRGVHDSGIQGVKTDAERIRILEQVFSDQREMIAKWATFGRSGRSDAGREATVEPSGETMRRPEGRASIGDVPQMFCAYKEVLGLYRQGLKVPDDVTIVWPDDNFGYVRNFASDEERKRRGGFGVYYHLSYLGAPMSYLWLSTTPPALVAEEMGKAYDYGARTIWIANVGDLKPAEIGTEYFLRLAWDVNRWRGDAWEEFLREWAGREFGPERADAISGIMARYYALNFQRKPEHLQWWLPKEKPKPSPLSDGEITDRLDAFAALWEQKNAVAKLVPPRQHDAFFELVEYPVVGSALANDRYFYGERAALAPPGSPERIEAANHATGADAALRALVQTYNENTAGGKWRRMAYLEPADDQWKSFRIAKWQVPAFAGPKPTQPAAESTRYASLEAEHFAKNETRTAKWVVRRGLGRTGDAVTIEPTTMPSIDVAQATTAAPRLDYQVTFPAAGTFTTTFYLLPTLPIVTERGLRFALSVDDDAPFEVVLNVKDGSSDWSQGVLNATRTVKVPVPVKTGGTHVLHVFGTDPGVVLDKIVIDFGGMPETYLGAAETSRAP